MKPSYQVRPGILAGCLAFLLCGCITALSREHVVVLQGAEPNQVERQLERIFETYAIPVRDRTMDGRVESGPFMVGPRWAGAPVEDRVDCGWRTDGGPRAQGQTIRLQVAARIGHGRRRPGMAPSPTGANLTRAGTRVTLDSFGRISGGTAEESRLPCTLKPEIVQEILAALTQAPPRRTAFRDNDPS
jgi:hypothetical protein